MSNDVSAVTLTSTGVAVARRARVKRIVMTLTATAGKVELRDGATGGLLLDVVTPADIGMESVDLPENGMLFSDAVHVTMSGVAAVIVLYV